MGGIRSNRDLIAQQRKKEKTDRVTRIVALIFAFISVFYFFIKLLFL